MYKIYINETPLYLINKKKLVNFDYDKATHLVASYRGKAKHLLNYIDLLEKTNRYEGVILHSNNDEKLIADFESQYKILEAAGGIVENDEGKTLMIFRLGYWDMAKGKIEKEETKEEAAIREVQEETGLQQIKLGDLLHTTRHTYKNRKGKRVIKVSYWFEMWTKDKALTPQIEEDIEQAIWVDLEAFLSVERVIYANILEVIDRKRAKVG